MNINYLDSLQWPSRVARIHVNQRVPGNFKVARTKIYPELIAELDKMGVTGSTITSFIDFGRHGLPLVNQPRYCDPGVAVWFTWRDSRYVVACDQYEMALDNLRGVGLVLVALRSIERHSGISNMVRAMSAFYVLNQHHQEQQKSAPPPPPRTASQSTNWWHVLGFEEPIVDQVKIKARFRELSKKYHPDGTEPDSARFQKIYAAYEKAKLG